MPSKVSRPLGLAPSTKGSLVPSLATDWAETYVQFPMSSFFEIGPFCWAQASDAAKNVKPTKAVAANKTPVTLRTDLFMASLPIETRAWFAPSSAPDGADHPAGKIVYTPNKK